jgi:hypothetical protein
MVSSITNLQHLFCRWRALPRLFINIEVSLPVVVLISLHTTEEIVSFGIGFCKFEVFDLNSQKYVANGDVVCCLCES